MFPGWKWLGRRILEYLQAMVVEQEAISFNHSTNKTIRAALVAEWPTRCTRSWGAWSPL